ncbi:hypothetical protein J6590_077023 [Homalodisca vitripennis]|nr:hypothetical protein J6590_077023 [Homalodisca vitripennis]
MVTKGHVTLDVDVQHGNITPRGAGNREDYLLVIRGTDVIWASNLELLELIFFLKEQAARSAAQRASIRFALLALLEKKLTRVVPNFKPRSHRTNLSDEFKTSNELEILFKCCYKRTLMAGGTRILGGGVNVEVKHVSTTKRRNQMNGRRDSAITLSTRPFDFDLCLRMGRGLR